MQGVTHIILSVTACDGGKSTNKRSLTTMNRLQLSEDVHLLMQH